jgi:hypothetical protein
MTGIRRSIVEHGAAIGCAPPRAGSRQYSGGLAIILLLATLAGCSKKKAPVAEETISSDRVNAHATPAPKRFLHKTFSVKDYQAFSFEVPPHVVRSKLHGVFQSAVKNSGAEPVSDESTAVELLLMTPEQFDDFTHRRSATSTYAVEPSFSQDVDIDLAPTRAEPLKYYLVFRNSPGGPTRSVAADFTLTFQ